MLLLLLLITYSCCCRSCYCCCCRCCHCLYWCCYYWRCCCFFMLPILSCMLLLLVLLSLLPLALLLLLLTSSMLHNAALPSMSLSLNSCCCYCHCYIILLLLSLISTLFWLPMPRNAAIFDPQEHVVTQRFSLILVLFQTLIYLWRKHLGSDCNNFDPRQQPNVTCVTRYQRYALHVLRGASGLGGALARGGAGPRVTRISEAT